MVDYYVSNLEILDCIGRKRGLCLTYFSRFKLSGYKIVWHRLLCWHFLQFFFLLVGILQIFLTFFYFSVYVKWMLTMIFFSCFLCECIYTFRVLYSLTNLDLISYKVYFFTLPIVLSFTFVVYLIIFFGVFHVSKWILYWNSLKSITAITTSSLRHLLSPIMPSSLSPYIRIQRCLVWQMCQNVLYMLYFSVSSTCFVIR